MIKRLMIAALSGVIYTSIALAADDGFLERRGKELYLNGKPFYEISFNKYDLVYQPLWGEFATNRHAGQVEEGIKVSESALRDLSGAGFKTIRSFCGMPEDYFDPARRAKYLKYLDLMMDLCDRYDMRVVFCLRTEEPSFGKACGEGRFAHVIQPESKSRALLNEFVRTLVLRYRDRKTIAMWEHANEMLLEADIGGHERIRNGTKVPTLIEVAKYHEYLAAFIRQLDPRHLITTGDSIRFTQWHLHKGVLGEEKNSWGMDTREQLGKAWIMTQEHVDAYCTHHYNFGARGVNEVVGADGKAEFFLPADYKQLATAANHPLYLGEYGVLPVTDTKKENKFLADNPDWFTSFATDTERAAKAIQPALDAVVSAHVNLTHWWIYGQDATPHGIPLTVDSKLFPLFIEANRKLQMENMGFTYMKTKNLTADGRK